MLLPSAAPLRFHRRIVQAWLDVSLTSKGFIVISIPLVCILCSVIALHLLQQQRANLNTWINRAFQSGSKIQAVITLLSNADRQTRGFLLTGDPKYLGASQQAATRLPLTFRELRNALNDTPPQLGRIATVESLSQQLLSSMGSSIAHRTTIMLADRLDYHQSLMDALEREFTAMRADESRLWISRIAREAALRERLANTLYAAALFSLVASGLAMVLFTTGIGRRLQLLRDNAQRLARRESLAVVVPATDELGRLAEALTRSQVLLAQQDHELRTTSNLLGQRNERLKLALRTAGIAVWELDQSSGRICYEDKQEFITRTQYPDELLPVTIAELFGVIDGQERDQMQEDFTHAVASTRDFRRECRLALPGHAVRWASVSARRYTLGPTSTVLGLIMDITERKQTELTVLQQSEELAMVAQDLRKQSGILRCVVDSMGDGVVVADTSGKFLLFNPAAEKILGMGPMASSPDAWAHQYGVFSADETPYPPSEIPLARALRGISVDGEDLLIRNPALKDGAAWISITARPLKNSADIWGAVVVFRDITERKRANQALCAAKEEAERANRAKSEFLSRMSHELRTPLNSILGFSQILNMHDLSDRQRECVGHVLKAGRHLLALIDEVLDIARIEAGRLPLSTEPVLVSDSVNQVLDMMRPLATERNITLHFEQTEANLYVLADRQRVHQVLLNLLSNAVKYNQDGGSVTVTSRSRDTGLLRISITDTGPGIATVDQSRLFAPFERLSATQTEVQGTGLGLALSKRLTEAMGGTIGLASTPGTGSTFWIELPPIAAPGKPAHVQEQLRDAQAKHLPQTRIVVYIEDNLPNIRLMEHIVTYRPNIKLISAIQARRGMELVVDVAPNLILLDLHLPDLSGEEVLKHLKADSKTRHIPVIVISADATPGQVSRLRTAGIAAYLTKPLNVEELLTLFDEYLSKLDEVCSVTHEIRKTTE